MNPMPAILKCATKPKRIPVVEDYQHFHESHFEVLIRFGWLGDSQASRRISLENAAHHAQFVDHPVRSNDGHVLHIANNAAFIHGTVTLNNDSRLA